MIFEGVNFNEQSVRKMKKKDFIDAHKSVFWLDRDEKEREKMLSDVYDTITGAGKKPPMPKGEGVE